MEILKTYLKDFKNKLTEEIADTFNEELRHILVNVREKYVKSHRIYGKFITKDEIWLSHCVLNMDNYKITAKKHASSGRPKKLFEEKGKTCQIWADPTRIKQRHDCYNIQGIVTVEFARIIWNLPVKSV